MAFNFCCDDDCDCTALSRSELAFDPFDLSVRSLLMSASSSTAAVSAARSARGLRTFEIGSDSGRTCTDVGPRPFLCEVCDKMFATRKSVYLHSRDVHLKNYKCGHDGCGKAFGSNRDLQDHLTVHTQIRSEKCNVCSKTFANRNTLRKHFRRFHTVATHST